MKTIQYLRCIPKPGYRAGTTFGLLKTFPLKFYVETDESGLPLTRTIADSTDVHNLLRVNECVGPNGNEIFEFTVNDLHFALIVVKRPDITFSYQRDADSYKKLQNLSLHAAAQTILTFREVMSTRHARNMMADVSRHITIYSYLSKRRRRDKKKKIKQPSRSP